MATTKRTHKFALAALFWIGLLSVMACGQFIFETSPQNLQSQQAATVEPDIVDVVMDDPENPDGYRLRRARNPGENWFPYFCEVFLWPYNDERLDHLFITMNQNGNMVQFIPDVVYEVEGDWILVLRGEEQMLNQMAQEVYLDFVGQDIRLKPNPAQAQKHPDCPPDIAFVVFTDPPEPAGKVMSGFPLFQHAGGVAEVRSEEQARQQDKVLRDIVDVIIDIQATQQASGSSSQSEPVSVTLAADELVITNNTPDTLYYAAFPQEALPLIEWAPCQHPDDCAQDRLEAGQTVRLPLQTVANTDTTIVSVFWWHLVKNPEGDGYHDAGITEVEIKIR